MKILYYIMSIMLLLTFSGCDSITPISITSLGVEYLNYTNDTVYFNGSIDITGNYYINGSPLSASGNVSILDVEKISFSLNHTQTVGEGELIYDSDEQTLTLGMAGGNVNLNLGQEILLPRRVKNNNAYDIQNGQAIYMTDGDGVNAYVSLARADTEETSFTTIAIATEDIPAGQFGWATTYGLVRGSTEQPIDTSAYSVGQLLFLSPTEAGNLTGDRIISPNHEVRIGMVFRSHQTEGILLVRIQNGYELNELHDVEYNSSELQDGDVLVWNSATSRFENAQTNLSASSSNLNITTATIERIDFNYDVNDSITSILSQYDLTDINYTFNKDENDSIVNITIDYTNDSFSDDYVVKFNKTGGRINNIIYTY